MLNATRYHMIIAGILTWIIFSTLAVQPVIATEKKSSLTGNMSPEQLVSIDFNNVDIAVFIKFISDLTQKNFVIDDRVKGKVSIISPGKITVSEAYAVFESVLEVHGYAAIPSGEIIKIVTSPDARSKSIKTRLKRETGADIDSIVTQIIPLRFANPDDIKRLFTPLVSKNSVILSYAPTNTLIITDVQSNINRLLHILKTIDVIGVGQQINIIPVEYADASNLVNLLKSIFTSSSTRKGRTSSKITFVADERTNVIIVLASEAEAENIRKLVTSLDKETPKGQGKIHVYYLKHASAEDLAKVLQAIPAKSSSSKKKGGKETAPVVSGDVRITPDIATNSLVIMGEQQDYFTLEKIIKKIDIPRAMVYIEALIMEVNIEKDFKLGTQWAVGSETSFDGKDMLYGGGWGGSTLDTDEGFSNITGASNLLPGGMSMGIFGEFLEISGVAFPSIGAIVQAYKKDSDISILSTPQILTTDNQEATIYVGSNIPFQTQAGITSSSDTSYNTYEYRDVGKTLVITPTISQDRMVKLNIALEVQEIDDVTNNRPTTLKRTIETTAIVKDKNTIVLGGLIDSKDEIADYKVPCLGDIPGLGWLFRSMDKGNKKTNLYIFLTPRVIQQPSEASLVSKTKREQIERLREQKIKLYEKKKRKSEKVYEPAPTKSSLKLEDENIDEDKDVSNVSGEPLENEVSESEPAGTSLSEAQGGLQHQNLENQDAAADTLEPDPIFSASGSDDEGFTIQVGSFRSSSIADDTLQKITQLGFTAYTIRDEGNNGIWYRLRVGYYRDSKEAHTTLTKLRKHDFDPILIKL
ncbi:MAG: type II secretion system secretin GspD [Desulfobacteraceae bacterium]|nr:type II secretion system secretin GspD [Desulfobacteraceae bacterium]